MSARYNAAAFGRLVQTLKTHHATLSVIESSTGGLISAGIMGQPGASAVYWGGSIAYNTTKSKPFLLNDSVLHQRLSQKPPSSSKEAYIQSKVDWTRQAALAFLEEVGTDFCVAQNGATGPTFRPPDLDHGFSVVAVAARHGNTSQIVGHQVFTSDHAQRQVNMELFAHHAAVSTEDAVRQVKEGDKIVDDPVAQQMNTPTSTDHFDRATHLRSQPNALHQLSLQAQYVVLHKNFTLFQSPSSSSSADDATRRIATLSLDHVNKIGEMTGIQTVKSFLGLLNDSQPICSVDFVEGQRKGSTDTETLTMHLGQLCPGSVWEDTRTAAPLLSSIDNELALHATALAQWQRRAPHCTVCGGETTLWDGGTRRECASCGAVSWPRQDPSMITVVASRDNQRVLLARSPRHPEGLHTALAGFVEAGETMERAVAREVFEETGIQIDGDSTQYVASQPWPFPQSTMIGFLAVADDSQELIVDPNEIVSARWFDRSDVLAATQVEGPVMQPKVAKAAFAADPTLNLLVPPRGVLARTLLETWLHRPASSRHHIALTGRSMHHLLNNSVDQKRSLSTKVTGHCGYSDEYNDQVSMEAKRPRLRLYNSLTDRIEEIKIADITPNVDSRPKGLACYTCGPTVYAPTHLGHARTYVCLDILRRVWEDEHDRKSSGLPPLFVMNITDVDDKILQQASKNQEDPIVLARRFEAAFWRDLDSLNCLRPHVVTRVTEHVESHIIPFVQRLVDTNMAYIIDGDGVYFSVRSFEARKGALTRYGKLAPSARSEPFFDTDDSSTEKKNSRDFVLWKMHKPGETLVWEAPWGKGRPGWHIECSAMIEAVQKLFAETHEFHVHTGGVDLKFPHHTNEIAQSEAYRNDLSGGEWIPHWVHFGHLHIEGRKMSKSLKNFVTVEELLRQQNASKSDGLASPADDFRLWCLSCASYRNPTTYSDERMEQARQLRGRIVRFLVTAEKWMDDVEKAQGSPKSTRQWTDSDMQLYHSSTKLVFSQRRHLFDDLNGAAWTRDVLFFVEEGLDYLKDRDPSTSSVDALQIAVRNLREVLLLVGFSSATVDAGKNTKVHQKSQLFGGETALIEALVGFRNEIRQLGLAIAKSSGETGGTSNKILKSCDNLRNSTLPSLGVELMDGKVMDQNISPDTTAELSRAWQYCIPSEDKQNHLPDSNKNSKASPSRATPRFEELMQISLIDLFQSPFFAGQFSAFDENGIPTHNEDGSQVSKRQLKKLLKKRSLHEKRLESGGK